MCFLCFSAVCNVLCRLMLYMEVIGRCSRKPEPQRCSQAHLYVGPHFTYTCAYLHKGLHLRFQMLVTKRLHLNVVLQYWTEPVKELCAYISQFHLKGPQLPIVGPGQCQMVQQRQSGAVEELHYMNHGRASGQGGTPPTSVKYFFLALF